MTIRTINVITGEHSERELTEQEIAALPLPIPPTAPTPLEQIRALEAQHADTQAKLTRQSLLILSVDKAMTHSRAAGLSREEVHEILMASDQGYAALYNLEKQVEELREQL